MRPRDEKVLKNYDDTKGPITLNANYYRSQVMGDEIIRKLYGVGFN